VHEPPPVESEPEPKRPRVDPETGLMSEADFARLNAGVPYSVLVQLPTDPTNPDWKLNGQSVALECGLLDTIRTLKEKLSAAHLGNMPPSKQQLKSPSLGFLKDSLTVAHFNIPVGSTLDLVVRTRGRR